MTDSKMLPRLIEHLGVLAGVLRQRPRGLLVDVDGTISPIASTPEEARVDPRCREALRALLGVLDLVAVVSGRSAEQARQMVGLEAAVYVGNHGLERWHNGRQSAAPEAERYRRAVASALATVQARLEVPNLVFEEKGITGAIHYRLSPRPQATRAAILEIASAVAKANGLVVAEGKRVVELRPPVARDKGTAVAELIGEYGLRGALYLGDDRTDVAAFQQLRRLRRAGICEGIGIAVVGKETPTGVLRAADYGIEGVDGVAELLEHLVTMGQ